MTARRARTPGWWLLAAIGLAQSMLVIDLTVVNLALPSIGSDLQLDRGGLTWAVTAYTLIYGSGLLLGGRLADRFGRRRLFLAGLATFTAASLAGGLASNGPMLLAARAAQGAGAAMLSPAALSILVTGFHGRARARALAVWAGLGGAGAVAGVALGGLLTAGPGWRWVFFINVPVAAVAAVGVHLLVAGDPPARARGGLDAAGAALAATAMGSLLFAVIRAPDVGLASPDTLAALAVSVAAGLLLIRVERAAAAPLIPAVALRAPGVGGSLGAMLAATALLGGVAFAASLYAQRVLGLAPLPTAGLFVPFAVALIAGAQAGARGRERPGPRVTQAAALGAVALGSALLGAAAAGGAPPLAMLPGLVVFAAGAGAALVTANIGALGSARHEDAGVVSGLVNTAHELGIAFGVAVASAFIAGSLSGADPAGFRQAYQALAAFAAVLALGSVLRVPMRRTVAARATSVHKGGAADDRTRGGQVVGRTSPAREA